MFVASLIILISVIACKAHINKDQLLECCGNNEKCRQSFLERQPLEIRVFEELKFVVECVEKIEHPHVHFSSILCCKEFLDNENDPDNQCYTECRNAYLTPTVGWKLKSLQLKKCAKNSSIFGCFSGCVRKQHPESRYVKKHFNDQRCDPMDRLLPGLYPVPFDSELYR